jgi:hypothetical protein
MMAGVLALVLLIVMWTIAGLIMWGAVATGQYFFKGATEDSDSSGVSLGYKIAGVLIPLTFIVPFSLAFFVGGITTSLSIVAAAD